MGDYELDLARESHPAHRFRLGQVVRVDATDLNEACFMNGVVRSGDCKVNHVHADGLQVGVEVTVDLREDEEECECGERGTHTETAYFDITELEQWNKEGES